MSATLTSRDALRSASRIGWRAARVGGYTLWADPHAPVVLAISLGLLGVLWAGPWQASPSVRECAACALCSAGLSLLAVLAAVRIGSLFVHGWVDVGPPHRPA
jgi:hypothetical protein